MTESNYPNRLINSLTDEQSEVLLKLLDKSEISEIKLEDNLSKMISPISSYFSKTKTYKEILILIGNKKEINFTNISSIKLLEEEILSYKFKNVIENLSKEEREKFENEISKIAQEKGIDKSQLKSLNTIGALSIASFSGFSMYIVASTVVGGLTSIIGITLPFAFYTGMSSFLSIVTGPIGWSLGLGYLAYSFRNDNAETIKSKFKKTITNIKILFTGNLEHCIVIISYLCACRILLTEEYNSKINSLKIDIKNQEENLNILNEERKIIEEKIYLLNKSLSNLNNKLEECSWKLSKVEI